MEDRLYFRAFEHDDLNFINTLRNSDKVYSLTCSNKYFISSVRDKNWIEDKIFNNKSQLYLMVCTKLEREPIGYIALTNIDYLNRKARFGGIVIAQEFSGKGYGTETTKMILNHVFEEMNLNMFYGYWREDHLASIRMAEKNGFKKDGLIRDFVYKQGKYHNAFIMSILKSEFDNL